MANTIAILEQGGNSGTAAEYAHEYVNGGKNDWHLPSIEELASLFERRAIVGGFWGGYYWSSSEKLDVWIQDFSRLGYQSLGGVKTGRNWVRPVRAF